MARKLKAGESVTVDRTVSFGAQSDPYKNGLASIEPGQVGSVVGPALQGRATIVEFGGIEATVSNQRLQRVANTSSGKKRGRKKKVVQTPNVPTATSKRAATYSVESVSSEDTSAQLITMITNTLLLNGGLKEDSEAMIQLRFADLPENVKEDVRALMTAKLELRGSSHKK